MSQVVGAMLLVLITVVGVAIIGSTTRVFVKDKLDTSQGCFELTEQVKINDDFTCYNLTNESFQVSVLRTDIELEKMKIGILLSESSFNFELTEESKNLPLVWKYPGDSQGVKMPSKEGSNTYVVYDITEYPEKVVLSAEIEEASCGIIDSFEKIPVC